MFIGKGFDVDNDGSSDVFVGGKVSPKEMREGAVVVFGITGVLLLLAAAVLVVSLPLSVLFLCNPGDPEAQGRVFPYFVLQLALLLLPAIVADAVSSTDGDASFRSIFAGRWSFRAWLITLSAVTPVILKNLTEFPPRRDTQYFLCAIAAVEVVVIICVVYAKSLSLAEVVSRRLKIRRSEQASRSGSVEVAGEVPEVSVWWAKRGDRVRGPISREALEKAVQSGQVKGFDLCSKSASGPWVPINRVFRQS